MANNEQQTTRNFDPHEHTIQLKSKAGSQDYLPVQWRLVWYRSVCPQGTIDTEEIVVDLDREVEAEAFVWNAEKRRSEKVIKQAKGYARFRAVVTDGKGGRATATGSEAAVDFPDFIEKAETKSVGRALAMLGYGTQFAPELAEKDRIVDAPVDRSEQHETSSKSSENTAMSSEVDKLRSRWGNAYGIPDTTFEERWSKYKIYLLGKNIADPDLTEYHRGRINGDLVKQERQAS
jgi:hypothetical protein